MKTMDELLLSMIAFDKGDPKRIQHFIKVHSFARLIGQQEITDEKQLLTLEATAIVHDIGIKIAAEKYGQWNGKMQELEGPAPAHKMLTGLGFPGDVVERVCYLVGHHHTYTNVEGLDYQILLEADFLVNLYEDQAPIDVVENALNMIFKTKAGTRLCENMFLSR